MVSQIVPIPLAAKALENDVLIVEDDQSARRALALLLCSCGFRPQSFRTAEEAVVWLGDGFHPRVALVDLDLPGIDGIAFIAKLRKMSPLTRAILVTATDEGTLARRLESNPIAYLRKPVNFNRLLALLAA